MGSQLLLELLSHSDYKKVYAVVKKPLDIEHPKLTVLIGNFDSMPKLIESISVDKAFFALVASQNSKQSSVEFY